MRVREEWWQVRKGEDLWEHIFIDEKDVVIFREFVDKLPFVFFEDKCEP